MLMMELDSLHIEETITLQPNVQSKYNGKVVVLINEKTIR